MLVQVAKVLKLTKVQEVCVLFKEEKSGEVVLVTVLMLASSYLSSGGVCARAYKLL